MANTDHNKAAELHENAAKSHRAAAEQHGKGDHAKGREHSRSAQQHSKSARLCPASVRIRELSYSSSSFDHAVQKAEIERSRSAGEAAQLPMLQRLACDTHEPLFWESELLLTFAHMPLPKSSKARPSPSIWTNSKLRVGLSIRKYPKCSRYLLLGTAGLDMPISGASTSIAGILLAVNELSMNFAA
jgi:hypothetical protein